MITGTVNADLEGVILLAVVGPNRQQHTGSDQFTAVIVIRMLIAVREAI